MVELNHKDINKVLFGTRKRGQQVRNVCKSQKLNDKLESIDWLSSDAKDDLRESLNIRAADGLKKYYSKSKKTSIQVKGPRRHIEHVILASTVLKGFTEWSTSTALHTFLVKESKKQAYQFRLKRIRVGRNWIDSVASNWLEFTVRVNEKPVCFFEAIGHFYRLKYREEGREYYNEKVKSNLEKEIDTIQLKIDEEVSGINNKKTDLQLNAENALTEAIANSSSILVDYDDNMNYVIDGENGKRVVMTDRAGANYIHNYLIK